MNIHDRLFVEIHPLERGQIPHPHPVTEGGFDPAYVYKVLGMYNASETSECYFILVNTKRQIWFIPQRHLLAYGLIDSDEFFHTKDAANHLRGGHSTDCRTATNGSAGSVNREERPLSLASIPGVGATNGAVMNGTAMNLPTIPGRVSQEETVPPTDLRSIY